MKPEDLITSKDTVIIFLDIDGVINPTCNIVEEHNKGNSTFYINFKKENMECLKEIYECADCRLVISSSWRGDMTVKRDHRTGKMTGGFFDRMIKAKEQFRDYGMEIYDRTPYCRSDRGIEINMWLDEYAKQKEMDKDKIPYIIIDDDTFDILPYHSSYRLIRPDGDIGLTYRDVGFAKYSITKQLKLLSGKGVC